MCLTTLIMLVSVPDSMRRSSARDISYWSLQKKKKGLYICLLNQIRSLFFLLQCIWP